MRMTQDELDAAWDSIQQDALDGDPMARATLAKGKPRVSEPLPPRSLDWF